ncbi:hypothetical protein ACOME3_010146 [Neoechinorhynchus agilis]
MPLYSICWTLPSTYAVIADYDYNITFVEIMNGTKMAQVQANEAIVAMTNFDISDSVIFATKGGSIFCVHDDGRHEFPVLMLSFRKFLSNDKNGILILGSVDGMACFFDVQSYTEIVLIHKLQIFDVDAISHIIRNRVDPLVYFLSPSGVLSTFQDTSDETMEDTGWIKPILCHYTEILSKSEIELMMQERLDGLLGGYKEIEDEMKCYYDDEIARIESWLEYLRYRARFIRDKKTVNHVKWLLGKFNLDEVEKEIVRWEDKLRKINERRPTIFEKVKNFSSKMESSMGPRIPISRLREVETAIKELDKEHRFQFKLYITISGMYLAFVINTIQHNVKLGKLIKLRMAYNEVISQDNGYLRADAQRTEIIFNNLWNGYEDIFAYIDRRNDKAERGFRAKMREFINNLNSLATYMEKHRNMQEECMGTLLNLKYLHYLERLNDVLFQFTFRLFFRGAIEYQDYLHERFYEDYVDELETKVQEAKSRILQYIHRVPFSWKDYLLLLKRLPKLVMEYEHDLSILLTKFTGCDAYKDIRKCDVRSGHALTELPPVFRLNARQRKYIKGDEAKIVAIIDERQKEEMILFDIYLQDKEAGIEISRVLKSFQLDVNKMFDLNQLNRLLKEKCGVRHVIQRRKELLIEFNRLIRDINMELGVTDQIIQ